MAGCSPSMECHPCAVQADMSIKESVDELAAVVGSKVDVLVNNAGTLTESSVLKGASALLLLSRTPSCFQDTDRCQRRILLLVYTAGKPISW